MGRYASFIDPATGEECRSRWHDGRFAARYGVYTIRQGSAWIQGRVCLTCGMRTFRIVDDDTGEDITERLIVHTSVPPWWARAKEDITAWSYRFRKIGALD